MIEYLVVMETTHYYSVNIIGIIEPSSSERIPAAQEEQ